MRVTVSLLALLVPLAVAVAQTSGKLLVAHRGASAYAPEHTLAAYRLALEQRADYVEQDLGLTRDGVLVCLHDVTLERTTNVEEVFPERVRDVDGARSWPLADFTLEEVKRLDAGSWFGPEFAGERVPTFQEAIDLVGDRAGLYPELKAPSTYAARGLDLVAVFAEALRKNGLDRPTPQGERPRVLAQSFDAGALAALAKALPAVPRTFLVGTRDGARWITSDGLDKVKAFATSVGPARMLVEVDPTLVARAHERGLLVIPYTFRAQGPERAAAATAEMRRFLIQYGVDGVFTDNPDLFPR